LIYYVTISSRTKGEIMPLFRRGGEKVIFAGRIGRDELTAHAAIPEVAAMLAAARADLPALRAELAAQATRGAVSAINPADYSPAKDGAELEAAARHEVAGMFDSNSVSQGNFGGIDGGWTPEEPTPPSL
jgi:hypothetical protein